MAYMVQIFDDERDDIKHHLEKGFHHFGKVMKWFDEKLCDGEFSHRSDGSGGSSANRMHHRFNEVESYDDDYEIEELERKLEKLKREKVNHRRGRY